ncbi:MAG: hypothetical protein R3F56_12485 [Planctomycetota bacterium]
MHEFATLFLSAAALTTIGSAQVSEYFLMAGDQSTFHVIQGGVLLRSWSPATGTAQYQYPLVVTSTIRTMGANVGDVGAEYDLNGTDLTTRYTHPNGTSRCWDGTTDGSYHYTIDSAGIVFRCDRDWNNPTALFDAGGIGSLTYDETNNSLWVSQFSTTVITEYSFAGAVLSSFSTNHTQNMALALDHADQTLWLHDRTTQGTFEQWSKTGTLLARIAVPGMSSQNALGGEMSFRRVARCDFRNGNAINPTGYDCVTRPVLGSNWTTSYNANTTTIATVLVLGPGGPATGPGFGGGEFLVSLLPTPVTLVGNGNITLPVPNAAYLAGARLATQGMRVDGGQLVLLNAQDVVFGL